MTRRENSIAIESSPHYSVKGEGKNALSILRFSSIRECHEFTRKHARTGNETSWISDSRGFLGLADQSVFDFDTSGIPQHALKLVKTQMAKMTGTPSRPGQFAPAVTGGFWDVPSVIAGLPLSARIRARTKLPPVNLRLAIDFGADVSGEKIAPACARLAKAIHEYTKAGGAVSLSVMSYFDIWSEKANNGWIECKVNGADLTNIATAFSPAFLRGVIYCLESALSDKPHDSLPVVQRNLDPSAIMIFGNSKSVAEGFDKASERLRIV